MILTTQVIVTTEKNLQRRLCLEAINININRRNTIHLKSDIDNLIVKE